MNVFPGGCATGATLRARKGGRCSDGRPVGMMFPEACMEEGEVKKWWIVDGENGGMKVVFVRVG